MKRKIAIWVVLLVCVLLVGGAVGYLIIRNAPTSGLEYELNDDGKSYSVTGIGKAQQKKIVIPSRHKGKPVTAIRYGAFAGLEWDDDMGIRTFCADITGVVIPNSVVFIEHHAFDDCDNLEWISISASVTEIEPSAFVWCPKLTEIKVAKKNPVYHESGNCLIETESKTLILGCRSSVIPDDGSVVRIGDHAFCSCEFMTEITVPDGITEIDDYAFINCYKLESVTISDSVTRIGHRAFDFCDKLKEIRFNGTVEEWEKIEKGTNGSVWISADHYTVVCLDGTIEVGD